MREEMEKLRGEVEKVRWEGDGRLHSLEAGYAWRMEELAMESGDAYRCARAPLAALHQGKPVGGCCGWRCASPLVVPTCLVNGKDADCRAVRSR